MARDPAEPFPDVTVYTFGRGKPIDRSKGPSVVISEHGFDLELLFAKRKGDSPLLELRLLPHEGKKRLEASEARALIPRIEDYLALARAALDWDVGAGQEAIHVLRSAGGPGRGHDDNFYRVIAQKYKHLVAEGTPHPVKTIAKENWVQISAASRWISEARRRGYLPPKEAKNRGR